MRQLCGYVEKTTSNPKNGTKDDKKSYKQENLIVAIDDKDNFVDIEQNYKQRWKYYEGRSMRKATNKKTDNTKNWDDFMCALII